WPSTPRKTKFPRTQADSVYVADGRTVIVCAQRARSVPAGVPASARDPPRTGAPTAPARPVQVQPARPDSNPGLAARFAAWAGWAAGVAAAKVTAAATEAAAVRRRIMWRPLGKRGEVRLDGAGEVPVVAGVPVDRPGHRAADARVGARRGELAAVRAGGQAGERLVDHGRGDHAAARGTRAGREAERHLVGPQAVLELDAGERGDEVDGALGVREGLVAAEHRAGVVVLGVHHGEDVADVQRELEVLRARRLHVDGLRRHRDDQPVARLAVQAAQRLLHVPGVEAVLQVDVDAVEPVALHDRVDRVGEPDGRGAVRHLDAAGLAADRQDHLLAAGLQRLHVGAELGVGVAAERRG